MSYINQRKYLGSKFNGIYIPITSITYDPDAQAYFNVNTAITSTADKNEINTFYLGLKSDGIYNKLNYMYFPIWLTATNCKWNLINNRTFDLTFATGFTYNSAGLKGNGTSAFANTFFAPALYNNFDNQSFGVYSTLNITQSGYVYGANIGTAGSPRTSMQTKNTSNNFTNQMSSSSNFIVSNTDSRGFFQATRTASNSGFVVKNNTITNFTTSGSSTIDKNIYLLANNVNDTGINGYATQQIALFYASQALTTTQATNFYTRVQTLMTYFEIQV